MTVHPELTAEQAYLDRAHERLDAMRRAAEELRDSVIEAGKGGTHQARTERDVIVRTSLARLEALELGRAALCFGRIDTETDESFYIGRVAVADVDQEPLVVDWRAPIAEPFYRATGRYPMGLTRRRHFATEGRTLVGIEDELLQTRGDGNTDHDGFVGPGALLAALGRSRSGHMRDIVATVQREQDEIIRASLGGVLVVQGGPGTGKTAVALHRAAYLLYTHRFPLETQGVLVVGPSQVFLRYIEQVLPSLGESGVALTTINGLLPEIRVRAVDTPAAARLKGDARMARLLANAVADRQRQLRRDLVLGFGAAKLRVRSATTAAIVAAVKRRPGTHNARRRTVESLLARAAAHVHPDPAALDVAELGRELRHEPAFVEALDRMWPVLAPEDLLNDLFGVKALLALASRGYTLLGEDEQALLLRPRATSLATVPWTAADVALLDEARALVGPPETARRQRSPRNGGEAGALRTYGHLVVDEAQDLSPMALRMLARRSISGSMTLVGDLGQATGTLAPESWDSVLHHLPSRRPARVVELTVNYRAPAEVMAVAGEVLAAAELPGARPPRSVRRSGYVPQLRRVAAADLAGAVAEEAADLVTMLAPGTIGVIASQQALPALAGAIGAARLAWGAPERDGLDKPVTLIGIEAVKGLEFDGIVVVEPAQLVAEAAGGPRLGLRALYVALTRATRLVTIVHADELPEAVERGIVHARASLAESPLS